MRGAPVGRRVPPPREAMLQTSLLLLFLCAGLCHSGEDARGVMGRCMERERKALLAVRDDIWDADKWLSSWERDHDCCRWERVVCENRTGHVVKLDLRFNSPEFPWPEGKSRVNPALLNLTSLSYLDLSYNYFGEAPIPHFIGGMANLESLILSYAGFGGSIPPELGSLQKLQYLDLSDPVKAGNLFWLSHLSNLRYLNMTFVDLSTATNWLHIMNKLPSLLELRLVHCQLPKLPTVLPHVNFTSLTTLQLSDSYFNATFPLWLFNISSLVELHLGYIHGPIPDGFGALKHLELLSVGVDAFEGVIPASLRKLENLTHLSLSSQNLHFGLPQPLENLKKLQTLELDGVTGRLPESLGNLSSLQELRLSESIIDGGLPESLGSLSHLRYLRMSDVHLSTTTNWLHIMNKLPSLLELRLVDCQLPNLPIVLPHVNFTSLTTLLLSGYYFNATFPLWLFNISSLVELQLDGNFLLHSPIPDGFGTLKHLELLFLYDDAFEGVIPASLWKLENLTHLWLFGQNLHFELPQPMENLKRLQTLYLDGVTGRLPESLGNLSNLQELRLSSSIIDGGLPESFGNLSQLGSLWLYSNNFSGGIPKSIGNLVKLKDLYLDGNHMNGEMLASLGRLKNLQHLWLTRTSIDQVSLRTITNFCKLTTLQVFGNKIAGRTEVNELIEGLTRCPGGSILESLVLTENGFGGHIPYQVGQLSNLQELDLAGNFIVGSIPASIGDLKSLTYLSLRDNQLSGRIPESMGKLTNLSWLESSSNNFSASQLHFHPKSPLRNLSLSNNKISGPIIVRNGEILLEFLDLSHNYINGSIPWSLCQMKSLRVLDLSHNHLLGGIPQCWDDGSLIDMKLSNNKLSGRIPHSIGSLIQLTSLHLDHNDLVGEIPLALSHLTQLVTLDLGENKFSGEIPTWLGESLPSLQVLSLRSNLLSGSIPRTLAHLQSLHVLDLACNRLSGTLFLSFQNLSAMTKVEKDSKPLLHAPTDSPVAMAPSTNIEESIIIVPRGTQLEYKTIVLSLVTIIDLSRNNLSGHISEEITRLHGLHFLNLSGNHLEGKIPENISLMEDLESLDLSSNQLSGSIPSSMSTMHFLNHLNVSYNDLSGKIPTGTQLQSFDPSAYIGNPELCGTPLLRSCPDDVPFQDPTFQEHEEYMVWFYIGIAPGFVIGFWGFIGALLLIGRHKRHAYFHFIDNLGDQLYVMEVVHSTRLKLKISSWIHKKLGNELTS